MEPNKKNWIKEVIYILYYHTLQIAKLIGNDTDDADDVEKTLYLFQIMIVISMDSYHLFVDIHCICTHMKM